MQQLCAVMELPTTAPSRVTARLRPSPGFQRGAWQARDPSPGAVEAGTARRGGRFVGCLGSGLVPGSTRSVPPLQQPAHAWRLSPPAAPRCTELRALRRHAVVMWSYAAGS